MRNLLIGLLTLGSISALADECSVSIYNFDADSVKIESILKSKGYVIDNQNPKYRIQSANYTGPHGEEIKVINVFERGNSNRIEYVEKEISWVSVLTGGFARIEYRFVKSLADCNL